MRRFAPFAVTLLLASLAAGPAGADVPTGLDPSYGGGGIAVIGGPEEAVLSVADDTDPSGRVVIETHGTGEAQLVRLTPTGDLDPSFGTGGVAPYPEQVAPIRLRATADAIYLFGEISTGPSVSVGAVVRMTTSGALDLAWGGDGIVELLPTFDSYVQPFAFDVGPEGEVVAAISGPGTGGPPGYRLFRLLANGTLDTAFGEGGVVDEPSPAALGPSGVVIDAGGRIVVAGSSGTMCDELQHEVRRLLPSGDPDVTFGSGGVAEVGQGGTLAAAISPFDGSIFLGGCHATADPRTPAVWKLQPDGRLDPTFGVGGRATEFGAAADELVEDLVLLPDHRIAVATRIGGEHAFLLRPDGSLETQFGTGSSVPAPHWLPWDGLGVGADGQLLVIASEPNPFHTEVRAYSTADLPTVAPTIASVTAGRASVSVRWDASEVEVGGPVRGYYVYSSGGSAAFVAGDVRQVTLTGLANGQAQQVRVLPFTDKGAMTASDAVSGTPSASAPAATPPGSPRWIEVTPGDGFATATWGPPADDGGSPIALYAVVAIRAGSNVPAAWRNVAADVRSASLPLTNGTQYSVIVMPFSSSQGIGTVSPPIFITPSASAASAPAGAASPPTLPFAAATATGSSAYVAWGAAVEHGEAVTGYQVLVLRNGVLTSWVSRGVNDRSVTVPISPTGTIDVFVIANSARLGPPIGPIHVRP